MITSKKILDFIKQFSQFGPEVENCFTLGNCYWFAEILSMRFHKLKPKMMYAPIEGHFGCRICGKVYDITGEVTNNYYWRFFDDIKTEDPKWLSRITKNCILKEYD